MHPRWIWLFAVALACGGKTAKPKNSEPPRFTLFVTTEFKGNIEPCGCTTDPHGDLARTAAVIKKARAETSRVLLIDAGSLLFSQPKLAKHMKTQETMKAKVLVNALGDLDLRAVGLGPYDLAEGPEGVTPSRQAANVAANQGVPIEPPKIIEVGGAKLGLFGVVSPEALAPFGIRATDPVVAARTAVAQLRKDGAQVVVCLAHMLRTDAQSLARSVEGVDFVVVGQNAPEPDKVRIEPIRVRDTWLLWPANRGQVITRLDVTVRGEGPIADAIGEARASRGAEQLSARIADLEAELARWKTDPTADQAFIANKQKEVAALTKTRSQLQDNPLRVPDSGSWFVMEQIAVRKHLPCDKAIVHAKIAYDVASGKANVENSKGKKPAPPAAGKPGYVGVEECDMCHSKATEFWKKTKHSTAWATLETLGKEFNFDCTYCHATGWDQPGGANLAVNELLRSVQCETCHGPGSIHVDDDGKESPTSLITSPLETLCKDCHTPDHSDTFDLTPYLRDVTGPGHGEKFRAKLGDGPTGSALRKAALDKAGAKIGAGCPK